MHPQKLLTKYDLTAAKLAIYLGKDKRTVERYVSPSDPTAPPESVLVECWLLDFYFQQKGVQAVPPIFLFAQAT